MTGAGRLRPAVRSDMGRSSWPEASAAVFAAYCDIRPGHDMGRRARPGVDRALALHGWTFDEWKAYRPTSKEIAACAEIWRREDVVRSVLES